MSTDAAPPGWYADPMGRHEHRWFDGQRWTDQVSDGGVPSLDPLAGGGAPQEAARAEPWTPSEPAPPPEHTVPLQSNAQHGPPPSPGPVPPVPPGHPGATWPAGTKRKRSWLPWAILGVVVLAGVVAAVVLLGGDDDDDGDQVATTTEAEEGSDEGSDEGSGTTDGGGEETTTSAAAGQDYPPEVVDNFMNACTAGGTGADVCQCSLDALEENFTLQEFIELEQQMQGTTLPDELVSVIEDCF